MKKTSLIIIPVFALALAAPLLVSATGTIPAGGDCTANSSGCAPGLYCVIQDFGSICSSSPTGPAATNVNNSSLKYYKDFIINTINDILVPVLIAIAFIVFLWGVFKAYIYNADNEAERSKGHQFILWGIIGFVVILSVWGLVNVAKSILLPDSASNTHPAFPTL